MTDEELLNKVKTGLGITGTYQDETLKIYIEDVKNFLVDSGVPDEIVNGSDSVGVIIRGVSDLWNYGMGSAEFSEYFVQRATQLIYKNVPKRMSQILYPPNPQTYWRNLSTSGRKTLPTRILIT